MIQSSNIDPPPPGPIRWRWVTAAFASLLRAARIISPDESVNIDATTGGFTLSQNAPPTTVRIDIKNVSGNLYEIPDLFVTIEGYGSGYDIPSTIVSVPNGYFVVIKIEDYLPLTVSDPQLSVVVIPISQLPNADAFAGAGLIYIPLAVNDNGFTPLAQSEVFGVYFSSGFRFVD